MLSSVSVVLGSPDHVGQGSSEQNRGNTPKWPRAKTPRPTRTAKCRTLAGPGWGWGEGCPPPCMGVPACGAPVCVRVRRVCACPRAGRVCEACGVRACVYGARAGRVSVRGAACGARAHRAGRAYWGVSGIRGAGCQAAQRCGMSHLWARGVPDRRGVRAVSGWNVGGDTPEMHGSRMLI